MLRTRRRVAASIAATASAVVLATAVPASAVTPVIPAWPSAGRVPDTCATMTPAGSLSDWGFNLTDTSQPTVSDVTLNGGTKVVVGPAGAPVRFAAAMSETCSGIIGANLYITKNGGPLATQSALPTTADAFHSTYSYGGVATPSDVGSFVVPFVLTERRYDAITLDKDGKLLSKTDATGGPVLVAGAWSTKRLWILAQTTLATSQSATSVKKGKAVHVYGVLKYATNAGFKADNGEKVVVQVKVGKGSWVTKTTLTAGTTGSVAYTFTPTATSYVRFIHATVYTGRFTAGIGSVTRTIKVV